MGEHVLAEELLGMAHGHQLDGMGVDRGAIGAALLNQRGMDRKMAGKLAGGHDGLIGDDDIRGAIGENADDGAIGHGKAGEIAHAAARALAIEITTGEGGQSDTNLNGIADGGKGPDGIVDQIGDINGDIAAITLGPAVLPEVTGYLGYLQHLGLEGGMII